MKNALVIGGSGMLAKASLWLADNGYRVFVVARNPVKMEKLHEMAADSSRIHPVYVDYSGDFDFRREISGVIERYGPLDLVVAWIHSYAKNALSSIFDLVSEGMESWRLFHVLGSSSDLCEIQKKFEIPYNCSYFQVQLGFILGENGNSKWLTHDEISSGVIEAIRENKGLLVGVLEPWEKRP